MAFGAPRVVVPAGSFTGGYCCCVHGDEVLVGVGDGGVAVFRDGALQRRIGAGELREPSGCAASGEALFVADWGDFIYVYALAGGARLRCIGAPGAASAKFSGVAARNGLVYATEFRIDRVSVYTEDGAFVAGTDDRVLRYPRGVAVANNEVFVSADVEGVSCVAVLCANDLSLVRRITCGALDVAEICVADGLLFATSSISNNFVSVLDATDGRFIARLPGIDGVWAFSRAVSERDGTVFVSVEDADGAAQLYAVCIA